MTLPHFDAAAAVHLLSRLQFGFREAELERALSDGLSDTLERLTSVQSESPQFEQTSDALFNTALATSEIGDLKSWWHFRMVESANPLLEKLTLHWHNHFATSFAKVQSVPFMAAQNELFRQHAVGAFPDLLHAVARDPAMLVWLDGNANRKRHPNENFAREVMELFTLGIGNYTEQDIQEAARAFSGWHLRNQAFWLNMAQHDPSPKTIFGQSGNFDGNDVLDLCLKQPACAEFLASKLLKTFVTSSPPPELIQTVAQSYRQHQLQTGPVLRDLCRSEVFFAPEFRRTLIKSPLDFVLGTLRAIGEQIHWPQVRERLAQLGQDVFAPPSVKGWEGGRQWIQSTGWIMRWNLLSELLDHSALARIQPRLWDDRQSLDQWILQFLGGQVPSDTRKILQDAWEKGTVGSDPPSRQRQTLALILMLPEYQLM